MFAISMPFAHFPGTHSAATIGQEFRNRNSYSVTPKTALSVRNLTDSDNPEELLFSDSVPGVEQSGTGIGICNLARKVRSLSFALLEGRGTPAGLV